MVVPGMAEALGVRLLDAKGERRFRAGGAGLGQLASIDITKLHPAIAETETVVACDVNNPLTGPRWRIARLWTAEGCHA